MNASRWKKIAYTGAASLGVFAGAAGIASAATTQSTPPAVASSTTNQVGSETDISDPGTSENGLQDSQPAYTGSIAAPPEANQSEAGETAALQGSAKITPDQARQAALAAVPGTVNTVKLENENGFVVYAVEIKTASSVTDVKVDAGNGRVLAQDNSDGSDDGASEAVGEQANG